MRYVCGDCGADAGADGCPRSRCGGPTFDLDTTEGRADARVYRQVDLSLSPHVPTLDVWTVVWLALLVPFVLWFLFRDHELRYVVLDLLFLISLPAVLLRRIWLRRREPGSERRLDALTLEPAPPLRERLSTAAVALLGLCGAGTAGALASARLAALALDGRVLDGVAPWTVLSGLCFSPSLLLLLCFVVPLVGLFAPILEPWLGAAGLVALFAAGGVAGNLAHLALSGGVPDPGAAAAAAAMAGCCMAFMPVANAWRWRTIPWRPGHPTFRLPVWLAAPMVLLLADAALMAFGAEAPWAAELGGLIAGLALGVLYRLLGVAAPPADPNLEPTTRPATCAPASRLTP